MKRYTALLLTTLFLLLGHSGRAQNDTINQKLNGKKEGYWIKHRFNGQKKWEGYFVHGKKTGPWKTYGKNGLYYYEGELLNGYRIGEWYLVDAKSGTKLDMTRWDGKGHCVGGATLSW